MLVFLSDIFRTTLELRRNPRMSRKVAISRLPVRPMISLVFTRNHR